MFKIIHLPNGQFTVERPDGTVCTRTAAHDEPFFFYWLGTPYMATTEYYSSTTHDHGVHMLTQQPMLEVDRSV